MPPVTNRLFYLDVIRVLALIVIILFHFNLEMLVVHPGVPLILPNVYGGIISGELGVDIFIILSGAALAIAYRDKFTIGAFYLRRLAAMLPMYWVAYVVAMGLHFYMTDQLPPNLDMLWLTVIGMDGFLLYKIPNAYLMGEWFFGMILILYAVFPILRFCVNRAPVLTLAIGVAWLAVIQQFYDQISDMAFSRNPIMLWPFMVFGMVFMRGVQEDALKKGWHKIALAAVIISGMSMYPQMPHMLRYLFVSALVFGLLVFAFSSLTPQGWAGAAVQALSKYSFPAFLMHHILGNMLIVRVPLFETPAERWALFVLIVAVSFGAGYGVHHLTEFLVKYVGRIRAAKP